MDKDYGSLHDGIDAIIASSGYPRAVRSLLERLEENDVVASVSLGPGRDAVLLAAVAARLEADPGLRALIVAPSDREVAGLKHAFDGVAGTGGPSCATIGRDVTTADAAASIGSLDAIASRIAAGTLDPDAFALIALSDLDPLAGAASVAMLRHALGSGSPERRLVGFAAELRPAHRAVVASLSDSVVEMELEDEGQRVKDAPASTYATKPDDKLRLLLGLLARDADRPFAVFCNLKDSAESVARTLRARGVKTEYVLGNLQRKRAVLDSVVAGEYEALVLTDEGAAGLPGSWAARLVNWDLPLEGEPYLARLAHLDASKHDARVYNFACERYAIGIPAIERALGSRLERSPADESLMALAGPAPTKPEEQATRRPDGRKQEPRSSEPRPSEPRERRRQPERRDRGGQYDGRNIKAIQNDIAAITGGKPAATRGQGRAPQPAAQGAEPARRGKKARGRAEKPVKQDTRQARQGTPSKRARGGSDNRIRDPYSISMEERLRLYRERYAGAGESGDGRKRSDGRAGGQPGKRPGQNQRQRGERRTAPPSAQSRGESRRDESPRPAASRGEAPSVERGTEPAARKGFLGALRGMFGKKDE